jgi:putative transposase
MKQRHSSTYLLFHLVFHTKGRERLIVGDEEERALFDFLRQKAHDLDAWIEEFGTWRDHVHLLVRTRPTIALSEVYGQMKGFSAWAWRKQWPDRPFNWGDGVWAESVDPLDCDALRAYIRGQRRHHENGSLQREWEPDSP